MNATIAKPVVTASTFEIIAGTYFSYALFGCFAISYAFGGWTWLLPALFVMVLVPALDWVSGEDLSARQPPPEGSIAASLLGWAPHGFIIGYVGCSGPSRGASAWRGVSRHFDWQNGYPAHGPSRILCFYSSCSKRFI
jgi:hypothetical protein